ncbi:SMP-30/gluconolactonase/LRE family protein [Solimonas marina]|uniref:SMP-30/gluconolactonase/LRE family protein n=1 Tax=Solimonas marina TaxID=2714601 RepID=A0A970BBB2_9GAMM|nr:SMP-30/gluconolactonase/LRE family protein [Solimonas marina]NKF24216.1 SMP-30/gluconolactonase/LRE family protein [Solimonas marina]
MSWHAIAELACDSRCERGDGPLWCMRRAALLWSDASEARLWLYRPGDGETRSWTLPDRLGAYALCESGKLLLGLRKGLYFAHPEHSRDGRKLRAQCIALVEPDEPRTRIGDGCCDRAGNFVFGTLNEDKARTAIGHFYQYSARHGLRRLNLPRVAIPNALSFSPDGGTLYFCDTARRQIMQGDYDAERARVAHLRPFASIADAGPAGATVDAEGYLWNAQCGGARVVRYAPDGRVDGVVALAVPQPSGVAFGGPTFETLYVTSARETMTSLALAAAPQAGSLFRADVGVRGLPESRFRSA